MSNKLCIKRHNFIDHYRHYDVLAPAHKSWYGGSMSTPDSLPLGLVWHYTAEPHERGAAKLLAERRQKKRGLRRAASWHYTISRVGKIWQHIPCNRAAWHCAKGAVLGHKVNRSCIGIEIVSKNGLDVTDEQYEAITWLCISLQQSYGIPGWHAMYAHSDFDPERRADPGYIVMAHLRSVVQ